MDVFFEIDTGNEGDIIYSYASCLLDKDDDRLSGVLVAGAYTHNEVWAQNPGRALEDKTQVNGGWRREFEYLTVYVNPTTSQITIDGHSLAPASATIA
jgi:hypothetical protein